MLRVLQMVLGAQIGLGSHRFVMEKLQSNEVETFKGIVKTNPTLVEYWMESIERILKDLDCTLK